MPEMRDDEQVHPDPEKMTPAEPATQEDIDTVDWARRVVRESDVVAQDALRQLVNLATALLAGSAALLDRSLLPTGVKAACVLCLLGSLASALFGALPGPSRLSTNYLDEIETARERLLWRKVWCLRVSSACLVFAFVFLLGWLVATLTR